MNASRTLELTPIGPAGAYPRAYQNVQLALAALENEFAGVRFSAPNSNAYLDRYVRLLGSMSGAVAQPGPLPPAVPVQPSLPPGGLDARLYNALARIRLCRATRSNCYICCGT